MVLRIPEIHPDLSLTAPTDAVQSPRGKKNLAALIAVTVAVVLLGAALLRGGGKKQHGSLPPAGVPESDSMGLPAPQPVPVWREPVVALPPTGKALPEWMGSRAEPLPAVVGLSGPPLRESLPACDPVKLEGTIGKQPLETSYDGPRSSTY